MINTASNNPGVNARGLESPTCTDSEHRSPRSPPNSAGRPRRSAETWRRNIDPPSGLYLPLQIDDDIMDSL
jgi:hypothetical protein